MGGEGLGVKCLVEGGHGIGRHERCPSGDGQTRRVEGPPLDRVEQRLDARWVARGVVEVRQPAALGDVRRHGERAEESLTERTPLGRRHGAGQGHDQPQGRNGGLGPVGVRRVEEVGRAVAHEPSRALGDRVVLAHVHVEDGESDRVHEGVASMRDRGVLGASARPVGEGVGSEAGDGVLRRGDGELAEEFDELGPRPRLRDAAPLV